MLGACGGSEAPADRGGRAGAAEPTPEPVPTSTYAFADREYYEVNRGACVGFERVGNARAVGLEIHQPKSEVGEFFYPNCLTDVRRNALTVKVTNDGRMMHNFIVEGDDVELIVQPGESEKVDVTLGPGEEIGFQCTIHANFMFGAFFRDAV